MRLRKKTMKKYLNIVFEIRLKILRRGVIVSKLISLDQIRLSSDLVPHWAPRLENN